MQLGKKESTYLRLRRTKLSLEDFRTVKVIGKGAFGEVRTFKQVYSAYFSVISSQGQIGTKSRYRQDLRLEIVEEGRDVTERSGELRSTILKLDCHAQLLNSLLMFGLKEMFLPNLSHLGLFSSFIHFKTRSISTSSWNSSPVVTL